MQNFNYFVKNQQARHKEELKLAIENYLIAVVCGIATGVLLAQFVRAH